MSTKRIWKFPLEITDVQAINLPFGCKVLTVQMQGDSLCLWAMVDPEAPLMGREVWIVGTGNPVPVGAETAEHIGSVQMMGGALVWHVFIEK